MSEFCFSTTHWMRVAGVRGGPMTYAEPIWFLFQETGLGIPGPQVTPGRKSMGQEGLLPCSSGLYLSR